MRMDGALVKPLMSLDPLRSEPATDPLPLYRCAGRHRRDRSARGGDGRIWISSPGSAIIPSTLGAICAHFEIHPRPADVMHDAAQRHGADDAIGRRLSSHPARAGTSHQRFAVESGALLCLDEGPPADARYAEGVAHGQAGELGQLRSAGVGAGHGARGLRRAVHGGDGLPRGAARAGDGEEARSFAKHGAAGYRGRLGDLFVRAGGASSASARVGL